ncbi:MAG: hypothetical protein Aurels2KO_07950 [Aureliella sp.]
MITTPEPEEPDLITSPDGKLAIRITPDVEGETMVSFHGFDWAIAGSQLAEQLSLETDDAIKAYVDSIMADGQIIAISIVDGEMTDAWVTEYPLSDLEYCAEGESLLFRRWNGQVLDPTQLNDQQS